MFFLCRHNVRIFQNSKFKTKPLTRRLQKAGMFARVLHKSALGNPYFEVLSLPKSIQVWAILVLWILLKCFLVLTQRWNFVKRKISTRNRQACLHGCIWVVREIHIWSAVFWSRPFQKFNGLWVLAVDNKFEISNTWKPQVWTIKYICLRQKTVFMNLYVHKMSTLKSKDSLSSTEA